MDVEGTMQFILEQQTQFASDIQIIKEVIKAQQEQFGQVNTVLLDLATAQERTNEIVTILAQRVVDLSTLMERHIGSHS